MRTITARLFEQFIVTAKQADITRLDQYCECTESYFYKCTCTVSLHCYTIAAFLHKVVRSHCSNCICARQLAISLSLAIDAIFSFLFQTAKGCCGLLQLCLLLNIKHFYTHVTMLPTYIVVIASQIASYIINKRYTQGPANYAYSKLYLRIILKNKNYAQFIIFIYKFA